MHVENTSSESNPTNIFHVVSEFSEKSSQTAPKLRAKNTLYVYNVHVRRTNSRRTWDRFALDIYT